MIEDLNISITHNDSFSFKFQRIDSEGNAILEEAQEIYFTIKSSSVNVPYLFQKKLSDNTITFTTDGYYHITINPEDTEQLPIDKYFYDIEVFDSSENYKKTIAKGLFEITYEITQVANEG